MGLNKHFVLKGAAISLVGCVVNNVYQALNVPAGSVITRVFLKILTACDVASSDCDIGITGGDTNGWDDGVALDAAADTITMSAMGTDALATSGHLFTAADTIDVLVTACASTATAGSIQLWAEGFELPGFLHSPLDCIICCCN